jgi:glycine cleavage system protein P-like pyridoxal-binding family
MSLSSKKEIPAFIANLLTINEELRKKEFDSTKAKLLEVTKNTQDKNKSKRRKEPLNNTIDNNVFSALQIRSTRCFRSGTGR